MQSRGDQSRGFNPCKLASFWQYPGMTDADERGAITAYIRRVGSRFQSYGRPERLGQAQCDEWERLLLTLADDIENGEHHAIDD
jgi:hypothetical protein